MCWRYQFCLVDEDNIWYLSWSRDLTYLVCNCLEETYLFAKWPDIGQCPLDNWTSILDLLIQYSLSAWIVFNLVLFSPSDVEVTPTLWWPIPSTISKWDWRVHRQYCRLTICIELVELTVSDEKIQITILILRRCTLSLIAHIHWGLEKMKISLYPDCFMPS